VGDIGFLEQGHFVFGKLDANRGQRVVEVPELGGAANGRGDNLMDIPRLRKRPLEADAAASGRAANEIDIAGCATVSYSSEDPAHPVEHLLDGRSGPGATHWMSARLDTIERIVIEFDRPQAISRLVYEVEEPARERTQEVRVEVSEDGERSYRQIVVQEYNFSPLPRAPRT
jgi:hypothetical protein